MCNECVGAKALRDLVNVDALGHAERIQVTSLCRISIFIHARHVS